MNSKEYFICSGELKVCTSGEDLKTVLGSCISICMYDRRLRIGGMNHFLLPSRNFAAADGSLKNFDFGDESTYELMRQMKARGSKQKDLSAFIVGGANIDAASSAAIGDLNRQMAISLIEKFQIPIQSVAVGGALSRRLLFKTSSGEVFVQAVAIKKPAPVKATVPPTALICIGASTGGTEVLKNLISQVSLPSLPILIVQHMPHHFTGMFAESLNAASQLEVREARQGELILGNHAYLAPGGKHMAIGERQGNFFIRICDEPPVNMFKPSVDFLFYSVSASRVAENSLGILLTGMGEDGAYGLRALHNRDCKTLAQNEESCVVFGMPKVAYEIGAVDRMLGPSDIAKQIHFFNSDYHKSLAS